MKQKVYKVYPASIRCIPSYILHYNLGGKPRKKLVFENEYGTHDRVPVVKVEVNPCALRRDADEG